MPSSGAHTMLPGLEIKCGAIASAADTRPAHNPALKRATFSYKRNRPMLEREKPNALIKANSPRRSHTFRNMTAVSPSVPRIRPNPPSI